MKKLVFKTVGILAILFFIGCKAYAQQRYTTHNVKRGETLESIAKQYKVTPYSILQLNKEINDAEGIKPNTVLVIQVSKEAVEEKKESEEKSAIDSIAPTSYIDHRVKRRETMYSLTQRYGITEEQLKKYNSVLYAEQLKKGMVLRIPQYPEAVEEKELDLETYTVKAKETRWSIANKYGITVDSLVILNPELPKNSTNLAEGQELKLPRPKGDSLKEQEVVIFESYTVPKSIGIFRISQNYGISTDSVIKLNPEIKELGGLKEGMVLRLPKKKSAKGVINTDNYIFYEVKPKQNIFRLTQNLQISRDSLLALNPELENGLKAGMVLKLPKEREQKLVVKNALVLDKKMGLSVNVKILDTERNYEKTKSMLQQASLEDVDAIIGPVDSKLLGEVALQASNYNIPVVAPYASTNALSLKNVFFSTPREEVLRSRILDYVSEKIKEEKILIIADDKHQAVKDSILAKFPTARVAKMSKDGSLHLEDFELMLSEDEEYWVFVETKAPSLVASISSILNAANSEKEYTVRMFTTDYSEAYENNDVSLSHLSNLKFTYPSVSKEIRTDNFTRAYVKKFGNEPDKYAIRGFDLTLDVLLKLAYQNNLEATWQLIGLTEYSGNKFNYDKVWTKGYYNNTSYLMQYDNLDVKQLK